MSGEKPAGDTGEGEKQFLLERSESPDFSVLSMKSERSIDIPPHIQDQERRSVKRSDSQDFSVLSTKSERSIDIPPHIQDQDPQSGSSDSQDFSVLSMKSERSIDILLHLSDQDPKSGKSLWERSRPSDFGIKSAEPLDISLHSHHRSDLHTDSEIKQKLKAQFKSKYQFISEGRANQGKPALLSEIYTQLYVLEGEAGDIVQEHEVKMIEKTLGTSATPIKCHEIFRTLPGEKPVRSVLTKGIAGIGKTVSVQKFIMDWVEEKANQDIQLLFPLPFRELNLLKDQKYSLVNLLALFFPEIKEHIQDIFEGTFKDNVKVLFIFDGLDECRLSIDFHRHVRLNDISELDTVDVLITNLLEGNLLPSALIWITSRPAVAHLIPSQCIHRFTEVRGFSDPQKEEYFRKQISDQSLANSIITHLKSSRSLFIMCHIPVFCWIATIVLTSVMREAETEEIPKTLTEMYTHFLMTQMNIKGKKYTETTKEDHEMILKLCNLAFQQLVKGNLIFYEEDLREHGIGTTEASVYSGLCTEIFREELTWYHGKVFCFVHLSIQEHLAALYVLLTFQNCQKCVLLSDEAEAPQSMSDLLKCAVQETLKSFTGHLDLFLRFLMGLSMESNQGLLGGFLLQKMDLSLERQKTIGFLKDAIKAVYCPSNSLLLFNCLNELNDHSLIVDIQSYLDGQQGQGDIPEGLWSALLCLLMSSGEKLDEFDLGKYGGSDDLATQLLPVMLLSTKTCLSKCNLTVKCSPLLTTLLTSKSNVRELDLSHNDLQDSGVEIICVGEHRSHDAALLIKQVQEEQKHKLDFSLRRCSQEHHHHENVTSDIHLKHKSAGLQDTECRLQSLNMKNCRLSEVSCNFLSSALSLNPFHLKELDLSWNIIQDSGIKYICAALKKVQCALQTLRLEKCGLTEESCASLASAFSSETSSLTDLDLSCNDLKDAGVKLLCVGLRSSDCKLRKLRMSNCGVTRESVLALAEVLRSNPTNQTEFDLLENNLEESDMKLISMT